MGTKNRDVRDGKILSTDFIGNVVDKHCVIVDDIIDGGYTFIELAKILKNKGAKTVYLVVSHGIFSKGIDELKIHIDGVYTTNSIKYFDAFMPYVSYYNLDNMCDELK